MNAPTRQLTCLLAVSLFASSALLFGAGDTPMSPDERILQKAGIATDANSLLDYIRRRTPNEKEQAVLKLRAAQLGSSVYVARAQATDELIRAGRSALPWLREVAKHSEAETARRAVYCIQVIEANTRLGLSATASRVLAERKTPGTVETLLAYLPFVDEGWVEDDIRQCLKQLAFVDGKALDAIEHALTDKEAKRRAVAAWIVGLSIDSDQRQKVLPRLEDDSAEVRYFAASSLLAAREPIAVPTLIALLSASGSDLAWRSEDLLFRLAGDTAPPLWLDMAKDNQNDKVRFAWTDWWKQHDAKIDWKSLNLDTQALGMTLVAESQRSDGTGQLYEINAAGAIRWHVNIQNPVDVQWLPGGRVLVGDSRSSLIYEMDTRGSIAWKHFGISPTSLQRLPNGNIVVSTYQKILELNRDGKITFEFATQGHTYHARKTADNHYVWIDSCGEIGEIDDAGKLLAKTKISGGLAWGSIEPLRNGRYLVALGGVGKVQEVDMAGKIYWEKAVNNPNRAVRLANGHTLVASHGDSSIYEFDAQGNERWKHACNGRPFAVQRR